MKDFNMLIIDPISSCYWVYSSFEHQSWPEQLRLWANWMTKWQFLYLLVFIRQGVRWSDHLTPTESHFWNATFPLKTSIFFIKSFISVTYYLKSYQKIVFCKRNLGLVKFHKVSQECSDTTDKTWLWCQLNQKWVHFLKLEQNPYMET